LGQREARHEQAPPQQLRDPQALRREKKPSRTKCQLIGEEWNEQPGLGQKGGLKGAAARAMPPDQRKPPAIPNLPSTTWVPESGGFAENSCAGCSPGLGPARPSGRTPGPHGGNHEALHLSPALRARRLVRLEALA